MPIPNIVQFTSETYAEIKADCIQWIKNEHPEWTDHLESDFGIAIVELLSGMAAMFRFYQNVTATESFPSTARLFSSLCRHAEWFGYPPHPTSAASTDLTFSKAESGVAATIPRGSRVSTIDGAIVFETTSQLYMPPGISSGTVGAINGHYVTGQVLGVSDGSESQEFRLLSGSMVLLSENTYAVSIFVGGEEWQEYPSLVWAAGEKGYRVWIDADRDAWIRFGDGFFGNIPTSGKQIVADYITGGGIFGNVGANTLTRLVDSPSNIASVTNAVAASGGAEAETVESLRRHMPSVVITRNRAVTRSDYQRLLEAFGEIEAIDIDHPQDNVVKVYVLPQGGESPSSTLLDSVKAFLTDIRMITEDVQVVAPTFVTVNVTVDLILEEDVDPSETLAELEAGLREYIDNGEFARSLYIDDIYDYFASNVDVQHATIALLTEEGSTGVQDITTDHGEVIKDGKISLRVP